MLPDAWVDSIFARLAVRYGSAWTRMWEGLDIAAVKADWASELGYYAQHPDGISHALKNLPDRPPSVSQFRELCRGAPTPPPPALPAPKANPEAASVLRAAGASLVRRSDRSWAEAMRAREMACERLTLFQRSAWRAALREPQDQAA